MELPTPSHVLVASLLRAWLPLPNRALRALREGSRTVAVAVAVAVAEGGDELLHGLP